MVEVTEEEYRKTENILNCHMRLWCRILNGSEQTQLVTSSRTTTTFLRYTDYVIDDEFKGPPITPSMWCSHHHVTFVFHTFCLKYNTTDYNRSVLNVVIAQKTLLSGPNQYHPTKRKT